MPVNIPARPDRNEFVPSPFTPSFGTTPPSVEGSTAQNFVNQFAEALDQGPGAAELATLITGQRGMGKSVLLNLAHEVAASRQWISVHEEASHGFAKRLTNTRIPEALASLDSASTVQTRVKGGSFSALGLGASLDTERQDSNPITPDFRHQLMRTLDVLEQNQTGLLITLDEVHASNLDELREITEGISFAFREKAPVAFVAAGLPDTINGLVNSDVSTYLRRANRVTVGNFSMMDTLAALEGPAKEAGKPFDNQGLQLASIESGDYPYLTQLIGDLSWRAAKDSDTIGFEHVAQACEVAKLRMYDQIHEPVVESLTNRERHYLLAMSQDEGPSRTAEVASRMAISVSHAGNLRERLISQGVLESGEYGTVQFTLPYTRDYMLTHASHERMRNVDAAIDADLQQSRSSHTYSQNNRSSGTAPGILGNRGFDPLGGSGGQQSRSGSQVGGESQRSRSRDENSRGR